MATVMRNKKIRQRKRPQARPQVSRVFVENEPEVHNRVKSTSGIGRYFAHHAWVARTSFVRLLLTPLSTLMTAAVIAIALSLPAGLYILLDDLQLMVKGWQGSAQVSVFLKKNVSKQDSQNVQRAVQSWKEIAEVQLISAEDALKEFQQQSGFGDALEILDENPLPAVLVVKPGNEFLSTEKLKPLADRLGQLPEVDQVQLDFQWIERLNQIIALGKRGALLLSALLAVAVLLVIGNTIRLTIFNRREEILVTKLIGATNQFIRRPFLYTGFWYGVFGAILAVVLIFTLFLLISGPVSELARLYNSPFQLSGMGLMDALMVFSCAVALGLVGSWIAVTRHIRTIEPE